MWVKRFVIQCSIRGAKIIKIRHFASRVSGGATDASDSAADDFVPRSINGLSGRDIAADRQGDVEQDDRRNGEGAEQGEQ